MKSKWPLLKGRMNKEDSISLRSDPLTTCSICVPFCLFLNTVSYRWYTLACACSTVCAAM